MKITVVIPTCHRNDLLAKCLDKLAPSVQTLAEGRYEVIVTDDGSKSTAEQMIQEQYPWARWVAGPRKGPAANRNNGARQATGEFLAFTDDDCIPSPGWLGAFAKAIVDGTEAYEGKTTCEAGLTSPLEHSPMNLDGGWFWSCNIMVDRKVFEDLGGFDESYPFPHMEDADLRERLKARGHTFPFVEGAVVDHPPRPQPKALRLGQMHECEVLFWYKRQVPPYTLRNYLVKSAKFRLLTIKRRQIGVDSLKAIVSLAVELNYVARHFQQWNDKYAGLYPTAS